MTRGERARDRQKEEDVGKQNEDGTLRWVVSVGVDWRR